jgi:parallel beta-helix repeat protein
MDVIYDTSTNTIIVRNGSLTLGVLGRAVNRSEVLLGARRWLLSANLRLEKGTSLRIAAPEVRWLKLRSDANGFVWIKALAGQLEFIDTCVTSWDSTRNRYDDDYADGRSFVLARNGARMDIYRSELSYLGYEANESYGVAWRLAGTSGEIIDSRFGYNFYGLYAYEASNLVIRGSDVHHNVRYGIDPHTRSNSWLIEDNISHDNGKHGIILAEDCTGSVIRNNVVYGNALHGIVLYQRSNNNLVEGNTSYGNGLQGINVNGSYNTLRNNAVYDNIEAGIGVGQNALDNLVISNTVRANRKEGITFYSDASGNTLQANAVIDNARYGIYIKSEGNTIAGGNRVSGNAVGIYLNVAHPPEIHQSIGFRQSRGRCACRQPVNVVLVPFQTFPIQTSTILAISTDSDVA